MKKQIALRKIRGQQRRLRAINRWKENALQLDIQNLQERNYGYIKFRVRPWSDLVSGNSRYPEPQGIFLSALLSSLLEIYQAWKIQLDKLNQPYYLKIWLFMPDLSSSQVVCALNERIDYYETLFTKASPEQQLPSQLLNANIHLSACQWGHFCEEQIIDMNDLGEPEDYCSMQDYLDMQVWYQQALKQAETREIIDPQGKSQRLYFIKRNDVWIGGEEKL